MIQGYVRGVIELKSVKSNSINAAHVDFNSSLMSEYSEIN